LKQESCFDWLLKIEYYRHRKLSHCSTEHKNYTALSNLPFSPFDI